MNSVAVILRAVQIARARGVIVTFEPGWEKRGNGYLSRWVGVIIHHTGTSGAGEDRPFPTRTVLRDGHSSLTGPLCNSAGPWDGSIHIVAAHAANHAGASGGRSMGPLPTTSLFNPYVFGHEIDYPGVTPMSPAQYRSAVIWSKALLIALIEAGQIGSADVERVRLHAETSITGKWDAGDAPGRPINAAAFRRAVLLDPGATTPKPPTTEEDDVSSSDVWRFNIAGKGVQAQDRLYGMDAIQLPAVRAALGRMEGILAAMAKSLAAATSDPGITPAAITTIVDNAVRQHTPTEEENAAALAPLIIAMVRDAVGEATRDVLDEDNEALAESIIDKMWARLTPDNRE